MSHPHLEVQNSTCMFARASLERDHLNKLAKFGF
ncbi:uncharacterized protein METZ01_LOCUS247356 [marine metagenome]|uniref:Uncharacterized protein n=1 Tax=marine metagenome TaxID=408172 RepID=A0A382I5A7_9ZZZZ